MANITIILYYTTTCMYNTVVVLHVYYYALYTFILYIIIMYVRSLLCRCGYYGIYIYYFCIFCM